MKELELTTKDAVNYLKENVKTHDTHCQITFQNYEFTLDPC